MEIEYIYEGGDTSLFDGVMQRSGVIFCPYCRFQYQVEKVTKWFNEDKIVQVVMQHLQCHRDGVIVLSRCFDCGEISWVHVTFSFILDGKFGCLKIDKEKILKEERKRIKYAKWEWEGSVCINCANITHTNELTHPHLSMYGVWVDCECEGGRKRSAEPTRKCMHFRRRD